MTMTCHYNDETKYSVTNGAFATTAALTLAFTRPLTTGVSVTLSSFITLLATKIFFGITTPHFGQASLEERLIFLAATTLISAAFSAYLLEVSFLSTLIMTIASSILTLTVKL